MTIRASSLLGSLRRSKFYSFQILSRTSSGASSILKEEERAAENIYIKKLEKEKLEAIARQGVGESPSPEFAIQDPVKDISSDSTKNVAVAAGVATIAAAGLWYYRVNKKVPVEEDKE